MDISAQVFHRQSTHYACVPVICLHLRSVCMCVNICGKCKHWCVKLPLTHSRHKWVFESRHLSQWAVWEHARLVRVCPLLAWSWGPGRHLLWWVQTCSLSPFLSVFVGDSPSFTLQRRSKDKPNIPISTEHGHSLGLSVLGFLKYAFASRPIILVCANSVLGNITVKLLRSTYCRGKTKAKLSSMSSVVTDTWE